MSELRLVVLGQTGSRERVIRTILGPQDLQQDSEEPDTGECSRQTGEAAGRKVDLVSGPAWFSSDCDPDDRRRHISSFIACSSPGPHGFLLCVPVHRPPDGEDKALDVLGELLGSSAPDLHTLVLFTHTEELEEDETLEQYLATWRKDLQELAERCGGRYHSLERRGGGPEEGAVEALLEKVELMAAEGGARHFTCRLYEEAEERVREQQVAIARRRRGGEEDQGEVTEEEMEAAREEAQRSVGDLDVDVDGVFPPGAVSSSSAPWFLWRWWEALSGWMRWLPTMVRREALLGALVGLFVGGPLGGMMGATVGSVATEVKRRKTQKNK